MMYKSSYGAALDDAPAVARATERAALDEAVRLLVEGRAAGLHSSALSEALSFVSRLWMLFIEDLASSDNALPKSLRADIISIGIWIIREAEQIRAGDSNDTDGLIEVCQSIREGLA
jgi:flagellar biosynthesis activator protein FlaF